MLAGSYSRKCKNSQGGVSNVWLMKYEKYSRSQIIVDGNVLVSFPSQNIFEYESLTIPNATETMQEEDGGKSYEQSISLTIRTDNFQDLTKIEWRILFKDNLGNYRIFGLYKGLECNTIDFNTGGGKSELNGYTFTFNGKEDKQSVFITDLNLFFGENFILTENGEIINAENGDKLIYA